MIFSARVDDCEVLLDDEMTDQRPTPEAASEYLHRAVSEVLTLYASSTATTQPNRRQSVETRQRA